MARNTPLVWRPRRGMRVRRQKSSAPRDDVATVHGWLHQLVGDPAEAEELLVEVLREYRDPAPACLRAAPDDVRLQFLTIRSVLRLRGVI